MNINWKVRLRNIDFWLAIVPAALLVIQAVAAPFGYAWDFGVLNSQLAMIINAVFGVLAIIGVVNDPTTAGVQDSAQAMEYRQPKKTEEE